MRTSSQHGMGLVEIVVGSAIILIAIVSLSATFGNYVHYALANDKNVQASYLSEEALEGMTFLRDKSWTAYILPLSTSTTYYLTWTGSPAFWQTTTTPQYVDGLFLRSVTLSDVYRDSNGKIASSGTYDQNTKEITTTISYVQGQATTTSSISTYITNLYSN